MHREIVKKSNGGPLSVCRRACARRNAGSEAGATAGLRGEDGAQARQGRGVPYVKGRGGGRAAAECLWFPQKQIRARHGGSGRAGDESPPASTPRPHDTTEGTRRVAEESTRRRHYRRESKHTTGPRGGSSPEPTPAPSAPLAHQLPTALPAIPVRAPSPPRFPAPAPPQHPPASPDTPPHTISPVPDNKKSAYIRCLEWELVGGEWTSGAHKGDGCHVSAALPALRWRTRGSPRLPGSGTMLCTR